MKAKQHLGPYLLIGALLALAGCGGGGGRDGEAQTLDASQLASVASARVIAPGAVCPAGGIQVDTGIDENGNGILDRGETWIYTATYAVTATDVNGSTATTTFPLDVAAALSATNVPAPLTELVRDADHARHLRDAGGDGLVIRHAALHLSGLTVHGIGVDSDMGVCAENGIHELRAESRPHCQRGNQCKHRERDADQADPGHDADPALGAPRAQVTPGERAFDLSERRGSCHPGLTSDDLVERRLQ